MRLTTIVFLLLTIWTMSSAQNWIKIDRPALRVADSKSITPANGAYYTMNWKNSRSKANSTHQINLPVPGRGLITFDLTPNDVLPASTIIKYPELRSWKGRSKQGYSAVISHNENNIHAVIQAHHHTYYIDPVHPNIGNTYVQYDTDEYTNPNTKHSMQCHVDHSADHPSVRRIRTRRDCKLRTYRLALACTGEYAQFHGGSVQSVLSAYNTAITRVNQIYERDLGVRLILIDGIEKLIFLDSIADPFSNNDARAMFDENKKLLRDSIGTKNYDLGHVFSTGGGGLAHIDSACSSTKHGGVTGSKSPINDPFVIDYVCHEIGHQLGGNHTQNNDCNRHDPTAVEVGSGSTIMGYAGVCKPNVQKNTDAVFHSISISEINAAMQNDHCAVIQTTNNTPPVVTTSKSTYYTPRGKPFALRASATDKDNDVLSYTWEQIDKEIAPMPPQSDNTQGPSVRNYLPTSDSVRYFPRLSSVGRESSDIWEVVSDSSRTYHFNVTVRDNNPQVGCNDVTSVTIFAIGTEKELGITSNHNNEAYYQNNEIDITWEVADTDKAPFDAKHVDISILHDNGNRKEVILQNIPNDGAEKIKLPMKNYQKAKIMIEAVEGIFYIVSDGYFTVVKKDTPLKIAQIKKSDISCWGSKDGRVEIVVSGGTPPYSYSINGTNYNTSPIFDNLSKGIYTVSIKDSSGKRTSTSLTIQEPDKLTLKQKKLSSSKLALTASGGSKPYTYKAGTTTLASNEYTYTSMESIWLYVTDGNGCRDSVYFSNNSITDIHLTVSQPTCFGYNDGSILAKAIGGLAPYKYKINNSEFVSNPLFEKLSDGQYVVTISDSQDNAINKTVNLKAPEKLILTSKTTNNNTVLLSASGGNIPYTYYANNVVLNEGRYKHKNPDMVWLKVVDKNKCSDSTQFAYSVIDSVRYSTNNPSCSGKKDGHITIDSVYGGTSPYKYFNIDNLGVGSYNPKVVDATDYTYTLPKISLTEPSILTIDTLLYTGKYVTVMASGGVKPYIYSFNDAPYSEKSTYAISDAGLHNICIKDNNNCVTCRRIVSVTDNEDQALSIYPVPSNQSIYLSQSIGIRYSIFDPLGRMMQKGDIHNRAISIEKLPMGSYILVIETLNTNLYFPIIKI